MYRVELSYGKYSGYLGCADTLEACVVHGSKMRAFYEGGECNYPNVVATFWIACEHCNGTGRIAKGRKNVRFPKYTDCKACHGEARFPLPLVG